jgi:FkbM family methyltransferase
MGAPTPKPVKERTLSISSDFGPLRFSYPDSGNMDEHVRATISGATYPWPGMPPGYAYDTIVDIGANIGASALWFMSCKPKRLVCFEPSRESLALLRRNVGALPGVEIHPCGLFDRDREVRLYHGRRQSMQHSVVPSIETREEFETIALRRASVILAELKIAAISLLKIDTEGCEVPILRDLADSLPHIDAIYVEYHSEQDRRDIDAIVAPLFILSHADSKHPHRGVILYVAKRIVAAVPIYGAMELKRPD